MEYKVTKQHWGDRQYYEGDTREVKVKSDAEQLMKMGLIADSSMPAEADAKAEAEKAKAKEAEAKEAEDNADAEKAAPKPKNKMAKEPENKAE